MAGSADQLLLVALTVIFICFTPSRVKATNCTCVSVGGRVVSADCSHLGWTRVPQDLPPTVLVLNMSGNSLASLSACPFCGLPSLETLDLSENQIGQLENSSFSGLLQLRRLSLRRNELRMTPGVFPGDAFKDLVRLEHLDLHSNQPPDSGSHLAYPDAALSSLRSLRTLRIDGLAGNVELGPGFAKLTNLEMLDMNDDTGYCATTALSELFFSHVNTSRPLTVSLVHCKLTSIHNNTFTFVPTLHSLDLCRNRHLGFPVFAEASKSLRGTRIKVLNISEIHKKTNIRIEADYFKHLAYTWLEQLVVNNVGAYKIDAVAICNLPKSMKYLSFYDNNLIDGEFLVGLYFLPCMETLQVSRQNHFSSEVRSETLENKLETRENKLLHCPKPEAVRKQDRSNAKEATTQRGRFRLVDETGKGGESLRFVTETSPKGRSGPIVDSRNLRKRTRRSTGNDPGTRAAKGSEAASTSTPHGYSANLQTREVVTHAVVSSPGNSEITHEAKELRGQRVSGEGEVVNRVPEVSSEGREGLHNRQESGPNGMANNERIIKPTILGKPAMDPAVCLDTRHVKTEESRVYEYLRKLHSNLQENNIQFPSSRELGSRDSTRLKDLLVHRLESEAKEDVANGSGTWDSRVHNSDGPRDVYIPLPHSIRFAYVSELKLGYTIPPLHFFYNNIEILDLSKNNFPCFVGPVFGLKKLSSFDLSDNFAIYVSKDFFVDMPSLTHLYLQGNFLGDSFADDVDGKILSGLRNLQVLNISNNYVKHLSKEAFRAQTQITYLSLARNALSHFRSRIGHMTSLTFLDLSDNSLSFLEDVCLDDLNTISKVSNLTLNLQRNPLSCGCESLDFWHWVVRGTRVRLHRLDEYTCVLSNGSMIGYEALKTELASVWLQCQGQSILNVAIGVLVSFLFLLSVLGKKESGEWLFRFSFSFCLFAGFFGRFLLCAKQH